MCVSHSIHDTRVMPSIRSCWDWVCAFTVCAVIRNFHSFPFLVIVYFFLNSLLCSFLLFYELVHLCSYFTWYATYRTICFLIKWPTYEMLHLFLVVLRCDSIYTKHNYPKGILNQAFFWLSCEGVDVSSPSLLTLRFNWNI